MESACREGITTRDGRKKVNSGEMKVTE